MRGEEGLVRLCCSQCGKGYRPCDCLDGFHDPVKMEIIPHPKRLHCCRCGALTNEFVKWEIGDSFSFGPLCRDHREELNPRWTAVSVSDIEKITELILDGKFPPNSIEIINHDGI